MPRKLQYGTLPGDGRAMQMHAASLHSLARAVSIYTNQPPLTDWLID